MHISRYGKYSCARVLCLAEVATCVGDSKVKSLRIKTTSHFAVFPSISFISASISSSVLPLLLPLRLCACFFHLRSVSSPNGRFHVLSCHSGREGPLRWTVGRGQSQWRRRFVGLASSNVFQAIRCRSWHFEANLELQHADRDDEYAPILQRIALHHNVSARRAAHQQRALGFLRQD